ncbi:MAG: pyridoxamine 5'-phosphate oxidase family protein [Acidiferrobacterales bacterium]|nr:pyridoxamine 5'-phosphate oxidase family protein [Acidiferrobacterales bacterium]
MQQFDRLESKHIEFIQAQKVFFVATAGADGRINLSPKGLESLYIDNANTLHWLNLTGSGNETAAHVLENHRMTMMFCSFDKQPLILRLYGSAAMTYKNADGWRDLASHFSEHAGSRQIFTVSIEMVQTSCGYAVPYYDFVGERNTLDNWTNKKSTIELEEYQQTKNKFSIDGKSTGLLADE